MFDQSPPPPPSAELERPFVSDADDYSFTQEVIERSQHTPVLVDCWAEWCGPCRTLGPTLERLAAELKGRFHLVKVNIDEAQQVAAALRIQSVPFMMLFMDGRPVDALVGNQPESALRDFLNKHLPQDTSNPLVEAAIAQEEGRFDEARAAYAVALSQDPHDGEALFQYARFELSQGQVEVAMRALRNLPTGHPRHAEASSLLRLESLSEHVADEASLRAQLAVGADPALYYQLGATLALMGRFEESCEAFLKVVTLDRSYREDGGRAALLLIFEALGGEGELVQRARRKLASLLF